MLMCTLPAFINNRWDTLVGLKLTAQAVIPDILNVAIEQGIVYIDQQCTK